MSILLKNAHVIDTQSPVHNQRCDLLIENGVIQSINGKKGKKEFDLNGRIVTSGWFDLNAHFHDPGNEFKEDLRSGTNTAISGGFTDVNLISDTNPPIESKSDVEFVINKAHPLVDLYVTASLSEGLNGENLNELLDLQTAGARSFGDGDHPIWNTELLLKALQYTSSMGVSLFQNPRDKHLAYNTQMHEGLESTKLGMRGEPGLSEELMIKRDLEILKYAGGSIHFSKVSSRGAVELIRKAKKGGLNVTSDVTIHHLLYTDKSVSDFDTTFKNLPPYRTESDRKSLIKGVKDGTIDAISSNHRPQDQESKQLEFDLADPGSISLQTFYSSLLAVSKEVPFDILVDRITNGPRKVLNVESVVISEGSEAKLTICDPTLTWKLDSTTNLSKSNNSPFWNKELTGKVVGVVNRNHHNLID